MTDFAQDERRILKAALVAYGEAARREIQKDPKSIAVPQLNGELDKIAELYRKIDSGK